MVAIKKMVHKKGFYVTKRKSNLFRMIMIIIFSFWISCLNYGIILQCMCTFLISIIIMIALITERSHPCSNWKGL